MVIVYHGNVESLRRDLAIVKPRLDEAYVNILGTAGAQKVAQVVARTLNEQSFFDNAEALNKRIGAAIRRDSPNKFILCTVEKEEKARASKPKKIKTAPLFYISEAAMPYSESETLLVSYIHEFDHFVWYALQNVPYALTYQMMHDRFKIDMKDSGTAIEWVVKLAEHVGKNGETSNEEVFESIVLCLYAGIFTEQHEKSNQILDRMVLGNIGINLNLEWRGQPRNYHMMPMAGGKIILKIPSGGDPYFNMSDEEVVKQVIEWENGSLTTQNLKMRQFMEMLKQSKVSRLAFTELEHLEKMQRT